MCAPAITHADSRMAAEYMIQRRPPPTHHHHHPHGNQQTHTTTTTTTTPTDAHHPRSRTHADSRMAAEYMIHRW